MTSKIPVSDLLAHRDGEHLDPQVSAEIEEDPESRAHLKALRQVKHALNELPVVDPGEEVWQDINRRLEQQRGQKLRYPLATAATVFLAAALGILWWSPNFENSPAVSNDVLPNLVLRSQQLESQVIPRSSNGVPVSQLGRDSSQQALMYRIADVDSELSRYYGDLAEENLLQDPRERERLWRQRVALLESLLEAQRRPPPALRTALY